MALKENSYVGLSKPISLQEPTRKDLKETHLLLEFITTLNLLETHDGIVARKSILTEVESLLKQWVTFVAKKQNLSSVEDHGVQLLPFGGLALEVVTKTGDIDAVCVVPNFVSRKDFFTSFFELLQGSNNVSGLRKIEHAYVPIITMNFFNVSLDLCMGSIPFETIPQELDLNHIQLFANLDPVCVRSLNGIRETRLLLDLVPDCEHFKQALRVLKIWCKKKRLGGTGLGFPGGISWAIMVARICQLYPTASVSKLVEKFFLTFSSWEWPQPVVLKKLEEDMLDLHPWNSKVNTGDSHHIMPIITPAYPEHNAAFTVTKSTLMIITDQMKHALCITQNILQGCGTWEQMFQPLDFVHMYKHFLQLEVRAVAESNLMDWAGLVESRIRLLIQLLEKQNGIKLVHPWQQKFESEMSVGYFWILGLQLQKQSGLQLDLAADIKEFKARLFDLAETRNLLKKGMDIEVSHIKRKQLLLKNLFEVDQI